MGYTAGPRTRTNKTVAAAIAGLLGTTAILGLLSTVVVQHPLWAGASPSPLKTQSAGIAPGGEESRASTADDAGRRPGGHPPRANSAAPSEDDAVAAPGGEPDAGGGPAGEVNALAEGVLPDGVTVFDDKYPGVAKLAPDLLLALREAAAAAAGNDVEFFVTSGWRSPEYQNRLLREAVAQYGSAAEAARWVASANTSAHVSGDAVDIGGTAALTWLSGHGADYGLCQIYDNEPWHYELRPQATGGGCPHTYADPTEDPRLQSLF
jgi:hypothetical protein